MGMTTEERRADYLKNRGRQLAGNKAWNRAHRDRLYVAKQKYLRAHPSSRNAEAARQRATRLRATPKWGQDTIAAIYAQAAQVSIETGVPHDVDHIVPLRHPLVCGLHVEFNLRVIPASVNRAKGNRFGDD
jgi:hypothetical protein